MRVKIIDDGMTSILCPDGNCKTALEYQEMERYCDITVFSKYCPSAPKLITRFDQLLCRKAFESDPLFRWCANQNCSAGQIVANGGTTPLSFHLIKNRINFLLFLLKMRSILLFHMSFPCTPTAHL